MPLFPFRSNYILTYCNLACIATMGTCKGEAGGTEGLGAADQMFRAVCSSSISRRGRGEGLAKLGCEAKGGGS